MVYVIILYISVLFDIREVFLLQILLIKGEIRDISSPLDDEYSLKRKLC